MPKKQESRGGATRVVIIVVASVIVLAIGFAALGGGKSATAAGEVHPVTITGDKLPVMPDPATKVADTAIGKKAPALTGLGFDGTARSVTPGDGKNHLVMFVAHWCPHCQKEVPLIVAWQKGGGFPANVELSFVSTAVDKTRVNYPPSAWLTREGVIDPIMADDAKDSAAQAWGLPGYPYFVLIKGDGTVATRASGEIAMADLTAQLKTALG